MGRDLRYVVAVTSSAHLRRLFDRKLRREIEYPGFRREVDGPVIRHVSEVEDGFVLHSRLTVDR